MARVIPVIDFMRGRVVRANGGDRFGYLPLTSRLTTSTDPAEIARALLGATGSAELYIADLDAIELTGTTSPAVCELIRQVPTSVLLDAGVQDYADISELPSAPGLRPVISSERSLYFPWRLAGPGELPGNAIYSLDLLGGKLLDACAGEYGHQSAPEELAAFTWRRGIRSLIVLDIGTVGTVAGPATTGLCRRIRGLLPEVELLTGGGVRGWDDVKRLEDAGADGVLVASALHDGTLTFPRPAG